MNYKIVVKDEKDKVVFWVSAHNTYATDIPAYFFDGPWTEESLVLKEVASMLTYFLGKYEVEHIVTPRELIEARTERYKHEL